jgi:hypothetical protein
MAYYEDFLGNGDYDKDGHPVVWLMVFFFIIIWDLFCFVFFHKKVQFWTGLNKNFYLM